MANLPYTKLLIENIYLQYQREALDLGEQYQHSGDTSLLERYLKLKTLCLKLSHQLQTLEDLPYAPLRSTKSTKDLLTSEERRLAAEFGYFGESASRSPIIEKDVLSALKDKTDLARLH